MTDLRDELLAMSKELLVDLLIDERGTVKFLREKLAKAKDAADHHLAAHAVTLIRTVGIAHERDSLRARVIGDEFVGDDYTKADKQ